MQSYKNVTGKELTTPLIYYGGKTTLAPWIIDNLPPHTTFVDVFGGGGAVILYKGPSEVDVYNDVGNVSNFFRVMRDHGEELQRRLTLTPFSREEFELCRDTWEEIMESGDEIEWARRWYVVISQGYTHEENSDSWHVSKIVNSAQAIMNHVDKLPWVIQKLRRLHVEHLDFAECIRIYDKDTTLFYLDPPYLHDTRADVGNYRNEMSFNRHVELLESLFFIKGQAILSGYPSDLYDAYLADWRRVERSRTSAIQNSEGGRQTNRAMRTEVLWIKEHLHGLWAEAT